LPVGLLALEDVRKGPSAISARIEESIGHGIRILIADASNADDLGAMALACRERRLITGAAGIGGAVARNFAKAVAAPGNSTVAWPSGRAVIIAGSCSIMTRKQIAYAIGIGYSARKIDPIEISTGEVKVTEIVDWVVSQNEHVPLIYSATDPHDVQRSQDVLGREAAGSIVEAFLGAVAVALQSSGFRRMIVAGGETSGAVAKALGINALQIGPEIDPGVPWTKTVVSGENIAIAFKSGNFGLDDFFEKAWKVLL
jgi:3-dehydrotetronate 4-kinase